MSSFQGRVVLITGAAGGLGGRLAEDFARAGAHLVLTDHRAEPLDDVARHLAERSARVVAHPADITRDEEVQSLVAAAVSDLGGVDVLINNAGVARPERDRNLATLTPEVWHHVLAVNLTGAYLVCRWVLPQMVRAGGGAVINIGSIAGLQAITAAGHAYSASKAGLIALTRSLAREYGSQGIRINAICPGLLETPLTDGLTAARGGELLRAYPLGRLGAPADISSAALFLASDAASWVTGSVLTVDGGRTA